MNRLIDSVKQYLVQKYNPHLIIVYGSYATGNYTEESDIDMICFCDQPSKNNDTSIIEGKQLDVWLFDSQELENINNYTHVKDGKIILDNNNLGDKFLKDIEEYIDNQSFEISLEEEKFLKDWIRKMFIRCQKGDVEGYFRYHWLLVDSLEIYFKIIGEYYRGPKKSLEWLSKNDKIAYDLFAKALYPSAPHKDVEALITYIMNKDMI